MNLKNIKENKVLRRLVAAFFTFMLVFSMVAYVAPAISILEDPQTELDNAKSDVIHTTATSAVEHNQMPELINEPILFTNIIYAPCYSASVGDQLISDAENAIQVITDSIKSDKYSETACDLMEDEIVRLTAVVLQVNQEQTLIASWRDEYYYATETWLFLKQRGYSDVVASAIIGNMMIETSGGSLAIKPIIYSSGNGFYGLCQWSTYYRPHVAGMSFEEQLEYLHSDMPSEFKAYGGVCYKTGFTFEDFLAMEDPATAAYAFAKIYERCGSGSYELRKQAAIKAYEYFTLTT